MKEDADTKFYVSKRNLQDESIRASESVRFVRFRQELAIPMSQEHLLPLEIKQIGNRKYVMFREDWIEKHGGTLPKMEEDDN